MNQDIVIAVIGGSAVLGSSVLALYGVWKNSKRTQVSQFFVETREWVQQERESRLRCEENLQNLQAEVDALEEDRAALRRELRTEKSGRRQENLNLRTEILNLESIVKNLQKQIKSS